MSIESILLLLGVWLIANLLGAVGRKRRQPPASRRPTPSPSSREPAASRSSAGPTQREGSKLEAMLRELGRQFEEAERVTTGRGPMGRRSGVELPEAEEVEELESLETVPEVESLDVEVRRPQRELVDQDDQAEAVIQRRLAWADEKGRGLTRAGHLAFDQRIRRAPAPPLQAARSFVPARLGAIAKVVHGVDRAARLREAIILRDVLGPPVGLH